jgi:hypothetical protein
LLRSLKSKFPFIRPSECEKVQSKMNILAGWLASGSGRKKPQAADRRENRQQQVSGDCLVKASSRRLLKKKSRLIFFSFFAKHCLRTSPAKKLISNKY